jgi:pSer/pThr/pTyr-binding forkhead associated (FHA) protein
MNPLIMIKSAELIGGFEEWIVKYKTVMILVIVGLLLLLLLLVAIRLFRARVQASLPKTQSRQGRKPQAAQANIPGVTRPISQPGWQLVDPNGRLIPLNPVPFAIGRDGNNHLLLDDPSIAPHHARIDFDPAWGSLVIEDLDSPAGIQVDGKPTRKNLLQPGMRINLGRYTFTLQPLKKP